MTRTPTARTFATAAAAAALAAFAAPAPGQSLTATASAVSAIRVQAGPNVGTLPAGSDLTGGGTLQRNATSPTNETADASFTVSLAASSTKATYVIDELSSISTFATLTARTGLPLPGVHQTELMLDSATPAHGWLRVRFERFPTGLFTTSSAGVDIDGDGQADWQAPAGTASHTWTVPLTVSGQTPIRTWTGTEASGFITSSPARLTVEFLDTARAVLPDGYHLSGSPTQGAPTGTNDWWSGSERRCQVLYEASHFLDAGVTGPILLERLALRGTDGVVTSGGARWPGVVFQVGSTSLTAAQLTTSFAANVAAPQTTMGPASTFDIVANAASGTTPNDDLIVLELGASFQHDPTGPRPNLIIDYVIPNAVTASGLIDVQQASGTPSEVRAAGVWTDDPTMATGTLAAEPPVLAVDFRVASGSGGYETILPARNRYLGAACGGQPASFYQAFLQGEAFDLQAGLTITPDSSFLPTNYTVTSGAPPVDLSKLASTPSSTSDDGFVEQSVPSSAFAFVGGSTNRLAVSTNGYIYLGGPSPLPPSDSDYTPAIDELLGDTFDPHPRMAPFWHDLDAGANTSIDPLSGLHVVFEPAENASYITWYRVGRFGIPDAGAADYTIQCRLDWSTGVVQFRYGSMPETCASSAAGTSETPALVGFSPGALGGQPSSDPQTRDLSLEVPFTTAMPGPTANVSLRAVGSPDVGGAYHGGRLHPGNAITWNIDNIPQGPYIGGLFLEAAALSPGLHIPGLFAPGCLLSIGPAPLLHEVFVLPAPSVTGAVPLASPAGYDPGLLGARIYAQFALLDLSGLGPLVVATSNAIEHTVGLH